MVTKKKDGYNPDLMSMFDLYNGRLKKEDCYPIDFMSIFLLYYGNESKRWLASSFHTMFELHYGM